MATLQKIVIPVDIYLEGTLGPVMIKVPCKCKILPPLGVRSNPGRCHKLNSGS